MKKNYYIVARKKSKYGLILYCTEIKEGFVDRVLDLDDVYINTFYYKGEKDIKSGDMVELAIVKGENGYTYCF